MWEFFLDPSDFMTRDQCGAWSPVLMTLYQTAHAGIALSYFAIPISLAHLYAKHRRSLPRPGVVLLFISFILLCGMGHVCNLLAFHWPAYRLFTLIDFMTALVSAATAVVLPVGLSKFAFVTQDRDTGQPAEEPEKTAPGEAGRTDNANNEEDYSV